MSSPFPFSSSVALDVECLEIIASDYISIRFNQYVKANTALTDITNYVFTAITGNSDSITVFSVKVSDTDIINTYAQTVYLTVSHPTVGSEYNFQFGSAITSVYGTTSSSNSWLFAGRKTKVDDTINNLSDLYDKSTTSKIRHVVSALAIQDDYIGGSQSDNFDSCPTRYISPDPYNDFIFDPNYVFPTGPEVLSITPATGTHLGGTAVTIAGTGFLSGATVAIGGNTAASIVVVSSISITCVTPVGIAGLRDVKVTNTNLQSGTLPNSFTYT